MKKILVLLALLGLTATAQAADYTRSQETSRLVSLGMHDALATEVAKIGSSQVAVPNADWLTWRNAANTANINVLEVDASNNVFLAAGSGLINLQADTIQFRTSGGAISTTFGQSATTPNMRGGSTSFQINNNANSQANLLIADNGDTTARGQLISTGLNFPAANEESVAGAGTTVADAAALSATKHIHQITGANGTVGWKFASATIGQTEILLNTTAGVPKIYAVSGGTCNGGGADVACTLTTGIFSHVCYATATNAWICS